MNSISNNKLRQMIIISLFAAIIGVLAQVAIPMPLGVPITGQTLAIGLAATILGSRNGTLATILYIIIGAIGIPVFAQMQAGMGVIFGPTGGFLISFIPTTLLMGIYLEKTSFTFKNALIANFFGMFITLFFGTIWLKVVADLTWAAAFAAGFTPFIIGGIIKGIIAAFVGIAVRERLIIAKLLAV